MVQPDASPTAHEPLPSQMVRLSSSKLYFSIDVPFEHAWLEKIRSSNSEMRQDGICQKYLGNLSH